MIIAEKEDESERVKSMMDLVKELNKANYEEAAEKLETLGFEKVYEYDEKSELRHDEDWRKGDEAITFTCGLIASEEIEINHEDGYWNVNGAR